MSLPGANATGAACNAATTNNQGVDKMLRLDSGGEGRLAFSGIRVSGTILESCPEQELQLSCEDLVQCQAGPCGTCECTNLLQPYTGGFAWQRTETTLTIDAGNPLDFLYCVDGTTLTMKYDGFPAVIFKLEKVTLSGVPVACAEREAKACAGAGCRLGSCAGEGSCSTRVEESACTNVQGCSWLPDVCSGTATTCDLEDYGRIPGCNVN